MPRCKYEEAGKSFEPYDLVKEENPDGWDAGRELIA